MSKREITKYYCNHCHINYSVDTTEKMDILFCENCGVELKIQNKTIKNIISKEEYEERDKYYQELCKDHNY